MLVASMVVASMVVASFSGAEAVTFGAVVGSVVRPIRGSEVNSAGKLVADFSVVAKEVVGSKSSVGSISLSGVETVVKVSTVVAA